MSVLNKFDTRVLLWLLFCVQLMLIGIFCFGGGGSLLSSDCSNGDCSTTPSSKDYTIQFLAKDSNSLAGRVKRGNNFHILGDPGAKFVQLSGRTLDTFVSIRSSLNANETVWCFREGTVATGDSSYATEFDEKLGVAKCKCKAEWHGLDCGQPEMVWRSLFTAKASVSTERRAKNIFYIIRTTEFSLETLEIQIMELASVVDMYILCFESPHRDTKRIEQFLGSKEHLKGLSGRVFVKLSAKTCFSQSLLSELAKSLSRTFDEEEDLVLISSHDEILNRKAINYLKWYNDGHELFRFRLKHVVYGFFWQHPTKTILKSVMVRYKLLAQANYKLEDLENHSPALVIGNLNHFGGWFCQLCYQPLDMIAFLVQDMHSSDSGRGGGRQRHRSGVMDEDMATKLIANGVNIFELLAREGNFDKERISNGGGGPMDLVKLHPSTERHYSPGYVQKSRGQFENIVRNLFARWELDVVDDYSYYN